MSTETAVQDPQSPDVPSPASNGSESSNPGTTRPETTQAATDEVSTAQEKSKPLFPPPKTDKPRPHVCSNCGRAFARLEHLKRHERSHTKEKPFECPECTRCFARRDLLLRHQQKLHYQQSSTTRPRAGRRESVSGTSTNGSGRVRKNSVANNSNAVANATGQAASRPRANTLGHLDLASLGLVDGLPGAASRVNLLGVAPQHRMSMSGLQRPAMNMPGMSSLMNQNNAFHGLSKIETHISNPDMDITMRTAPPLGGFGGFPLDQLFDGANGNTVNPAQLHFGASTDSPAALLATFPLFDMPANDLQADDLSWMNNWDSTQLMANFANETAVDESSPSGMSSAASQSAFTESMMGLQNNMATSHGAWAMNDMTMQPLMTPTAFQLDMLGTGLPNLDTPPDTVSPQHLHGSPANDNYFNTRMLQNNHVDISHTPFIPPAPVSNFSSDSPSMSSSMTGSARQSSVTSVSTDSITDATRQALLNSLSQPSVFGHNHRKYSLPSVSSPLSPGGVLRHGPSLPTTTDLQRYVNAYITYFHPHLPFLHIPTLSFESPDYMSNLRAANVQTSINHNGIVGGGGCLILAMAAIGALYEYDHQASKELFDSAKRMIGLYLEERRKADMSAALNGPYVNNANSRHNTPLWLVQAMLLNVIYGHHCGDKRSADIASTHCAALVSLARAAELARPVADGQNAQDFEFHDDDFKMQDGQSPFNEHSQQPPQSAAHLAWCKWKDAEERKRTLFAIFILSSLLVTAYNQSPAIMNSEIALDLPCDEELWAADCANEWVKCGGNYAAEHNSFPFATALSTLLTANQKSSNVYTANSYTSKTNGAYTGNGMPEAELRSSTFGCLVLINALHNYIWETRSRHHGRQWTAQETEAMFAHIEPALNAWQRAWKANDHHHLQRPNPYNCGPLSADSIPLLDLAFVRLFVNLGRSKEAFWQRDFDAMANELARGSEIVQHAAATPGSNTEANPTDHSMDSPNALSGSPAVGPQRQLHRPGHSLSTGQCSKRERHLRKAAFYAADSLTMATKFCLTYADGASHQLPIQSAMCFFDCSQVLAEWAATVQERVGRYLGVLGRDDIDLTQVPAIMLLEAEDIELLNKVETICTVMEEKMVQQANMYSELGALDPKNPLTSFHHHIDRLPELQECGISSKVLKVIGLMLEKDPTWPVTHLMANALQVHATHMDQRAEASLTASE